MNEFKKPKITVLIPTKDRVKYLIHTLNTCTSQDYENLEIIVSDDGSIDDTKKIVYELSKSDKRLKYITPQPLSGMLNNFEYALNQVFSGFVLMLGGDDGLMPGSIKKLAEIIEKNEAELISWNTPIYSYPGTRTENGQLIVPFGNKQYEVDTSVYLKRQAQNLNYTGDKESPMFYVKGLASIKLINRVKAKSNNNMFYSCATPDGFSGIVLAGEVKKFLYFDYPFTMHGLSPSSQGLSYLSNAQEAKKISEEFFNESNNRPMHQNLGGEKYSPLITLMTADYLLTAASLNKWQGEIPEINYKTLIDKSIEELCHGIYAKERISRELYIIKNIAKFHGLESYFEKAIKKEFRYKSRRPIEGMAINTNSIFIDAKKFNINNIYEATIIAGTINSIINNFSVKNAILIMVKSISYKIKSLIKDKNEKLENYI
jgi:glycosyltransferase involved in cell wall biosynthesis